MGLLYGLSQKDEVVFGRSDEEDSLEMHKFFLDVLYLLDEIDIVFVQFGLGVDDGDDTRGLGVKDESFHFGDLAENGVEVVLGNG